MGKPNGQWVGGRENVDVHYRDAHYRDAHYRDARYRDTHSSGLKLCLLDHHHLLCRKVRETWTPASL